jgi:putative ABC transport system permease protein
VTAPRSASVEVARPAAVAASLSVARGPMSGADTKIILWIAGVALLVLLIACANVANLLLARALRRRREIAVRRALGGTSARLVRQLLTETMLLSLLGALAGLLAAQLVSGSLRKVLAGADTSWAVATDSRTVIFSVLLALFTALLAGLAPALGVGRFALAETLRAGTREGSYRHSRARAALLVAQTAISVVLLIGAGLFVRSLQQVRSLSKGYDLDHLIWIEAGTRGPDFTAAEQHSLSSELLSTARSTPGVRRASLTVSAPFYFSEDHQMWVDGVDSVGKLGNFQLQAGSPEYFETLGTRVMRGRGFTAEDRVGTPPVAVVSIGMARKLWKTDNPIGKCFRIETRDSPCITVIGVAENTKAQNITGDGEMMYYLPIDQYESRFGQLPMLALFARVAGRPEDFVENLRGRLQARMPGSSYVSLRPFHTIVDPTMRSWTSGARMFVIFGAFAVALAGIGLYAVIAFTVAQRRSELGVRLALGARAGDLLRLVVGGGVRVTLLGVFLGTVVALMAGPYVSPMLFRVSPRDPIVFGSVLATLMLIAVLASAIPAWRATRVDPNLALRPE